MISYSRCWNWICIWFADYWLCQESFLKATTVFICHLGLCFIRGHGFILSYDGFSALICLLSHNIHIKYYWYSFSASLPRQRRLALWERRQLSLVARDAMKSLEKLRFFMVRWGAMVQQWIRNNKNCNTLLCPVQAFSLFIISWSTVSCSV